MVGHKGDKYEQRLVRLLADGGYFPMKAPSSGSGTERAMPDIIALREDEDVVIEQKYIGTRDGKVYLEPSELDAIRDVAEVVGNGAKPRITVRWRSDGAFYVFDPDDVPRSDGGDGDSYRITRNMLTDDVHLAELADPELVGGHGRTAEAIRRVGVDDREVDHA